MIYYYKIKIKNNMKNTIKLWLIDLVSFTTFFLLFGIFNPFTVLLIGFIFITPYFLITNRKNYLKYFLISILFGIIWSLISKGNYSYNTNFPDFLGINFYLLLAWSAGLFVFYILFLNIKKIQKYNFVIKFLIFFIIYSSTLLLVESIAYHVFGIHNELAKNYPPIKFCECIHAPRWTQISYFILGPAYFIISESINKLTKNKNS